MAYDKKSVIHLLQILGYQEQADEAAQALSDPVSLDELIAFLKSHALNQ